MPGVTMIAAPGESPGHAIVRVRSGGERFYFLGDLFHHACEVVSTDWVSPGRNQHVLRASRERLIADAVATRATLAFTHGLFPPWGRIVPADGGYRWEPHSHIPKHQQPDTRSTGTPTIERRAPPNDRVARVSPPPAHQASRVAAIRNPHSQSAIRLCYSRRAAGLALVHSHHGHARYNRAAMRAFHSVVATGRWAGGSGDTG